MFRDNNHFRVMLATVVDHALYFSGWDATKVNSWPIVNNLIAKHGYNTGDILQTITDDYLAEMVGEQWDEDIRAAQEESEDGYNEESLFDLHDEDTQEALKRLRDKLSNNTVIPSSTDNHDGPPF